MPHVEILGRPSEVSSQLLSFYCTSSLPTLASVDMILAELNDFWTLEDA